MNQTSPCPYCGASGGYHVWAGSGGCPGAVSERERDQAAAAYIRLLLEDLARASTQSIELREELEACRILLARAADALGKHLPGRLGNKFDHPDYVLIDELRKAAQ